MGYESVKGRGAVEGLEPEDIENRVSYLIKFYLGTRSPAIALSVARHLELLVSHPRLECDEGQRCDYLRMRRQWRWLADAGAPAGVG